jgi:hypothetical protein
MRLGGFETNTTVVRPVETRSQRTDANQNKIATVRVSKVDFSNVESRKTKYGSAANRTRGDEGSTNAAIEGRQLDDRAMMPIGR